MFHENFFLLVFKNSLNVKIYFISLILIIFLRKHKFFYIIFRIVMDKINDKFFIYKIFLKLIKIKICWCLRLSCYKNLRILFYLLYNRLWYNILWQILINNCEENIMLFNYYLRCFIKLSNIISIFMFWV